MEQNPLIYANTTIISAMNRNKNNYYDITAYVVVATGRESEIHIKLQTKKIKDGNSSMHKQS